MRLRNCACMSVPVKYTHIYGVIESVFPLPSHLQSKIASTFDTAPNTMQNNNNNDIKNWLSYIMCFSVCTNIYTNIDKAKSKTAHVFVWLAYQWCTHVWVWFFQCFILVFGGKPFNFIRSCCWICHSIKVINFEQTITNNGDNDNIDK